MKIVLPNKLFFNNLIFNMGQFNLNSSKQNSQQYLMKYLRRSQARGKCENGGNKAF